ncbi:TonB-dependent receptor [Dyella acidiphila]|uniref:TonB-dependent receptor n=1 Tax=Dyella acidiphila TaxID=2775866 RepID=A0ABR9G9D5_9GAMM|nr:TonB-dependent receptor [Dyella acidiphila]MBE1160660.1 TonB-dependent receptor [Dyella acidiphila]
MFVVKKHVLAYAIVAAIGCLAAVPAAHAGDVSGEIADPATGNPLAGVAVTVAATGQTVKTDASGHFQLTGLAAGHYLLTANASAAHALSATVEVPAQGSVQANFSSIASLSKISVAANRYDASQLQMDAVNTVNVLSADDLKYTAVHNVAEALGLFPGVNVFNTGQSYFAGIDGASRGEGMFTSVRGLNAEYNVNLIDGVEVAQGMPYSRGVQLSLLPPSGLQTIVLNKTSTADMDGDAIGGTIDFRTPTAFDFSAPTSGSITASGRMESRARDYGDDGLGGGAAGEFQTKFGDAHQFGIYASAYYDSRSYVNSEMAGATAALGDGAWEFARTTASGANAAGIDPQHNLESTGMYLGTSSGYTHRYGGNVSLDWKVDDTLHTYARMTYAYAKTEQDTTYLQLIPANVSYSPIGNTGVYQPVIGRIATRFWYETNPEKADLATFQLGADKTLGGWTLSPNIFYSYGDNDRPDHVEISARNDEYTSTNFPYGASTVMTYGANGFAYPLLTPAMSAQLNSVATMYARRAGELTETYSGQRKGGAKFDARYDFDDGALSSIQLGVKYVDSDRDMSDRDWTTGKYTDGRSFGSLGLIDGYYSSVFPGVYGYAAPTIDQAALKRLIAANVVPADLDTCSSLYVNNWNCDTQRANEAVSAAYAMATLKWGDLEVIPGLRFEHTDIRNTFWVIPQDAQGNEIPGYFARNYTHYDEPLPSIFINYRPSDNAVYRGSIWTSYTRPAFVQLGGGSQVSVSADGLTTITEGNPELKPIEALNIDFSGEWNNQHGGHAMLAGFYKKLSNYIYEAGTNPVNAATVDAGSIQYIRPSNGGAGRVYGVEAAVRQKFQDLPAPLDGFGVAVNATAQRTSVDLGMAGFNHERIQNAPDLMANAELFYEKNDFSVNLSYHYAGSYLSTYDYLGQGAAWDDLWIRPTERIDLHVGYAFSRRFQLDLSISNLTKNYSYWAHVGKNNLALSDVVDSGMTTLLTAKYSF